MSVEMCAGVTVDGVIVETCAVPVDSCMCTLLLTVTLFDKIVTETVVTVGVVVFCRLETDDVDTLLMFCTICELEAGEEFTGTVVVICPVELVATDAGDDVLVNEAAVEVNASETVRLTIRMTNKPIPYISLPITINAK